MKKALDKNWLYLIVILLFSLIGMKALLHPGLYTAHDIWHQVVRFYYYAQAINDGQFTPLWISKLANGFGYPLFFFSYHLPWLIGTPLIKLGLDIPNALKSLFFISFLASGITMYFFVNSLLKDKLSALLSAILYLWLPYHFLVIFVGASIGVAFVFAFLPLVFLGILLLKEKSLFAVSIFSIGLAGIILSHIMHLAFVLPIVIIFTFWAFKFSQSKSFFIRNLFFGITLGILLSSFYLIPAFYYNQSTRVHQEEGITKLFERNFITLKQLIYSRWGFSPIVNNAKNGEISFQLGIAQWLSIFALTFLIFVKKLKINYKTLSIYLLMSILISVFLMLDYSLAFWKFTVKFVALDFPFRLLLPATFIASVCAGVLLANFNKKIQALIFMFLVSVSIYTNRNHINVNQYTNFPISTYLSLETEITTNTFNEYLPIKASPKLLGKPWNEVVGNNLTFSGTKQTTKSLSFNVDSKNDTLVSLGQFFFPGQTLYLDKNKKKISIDKEGRINLTIPKGKHNIEIKFEETTLIQVSKFLTLLGVLLTLYLFFRKKITVN